MPPASSAPADATEEDVLDFVDNVPANLVDCRADHHKFTPQNVIAYLASGKVTKDYRKAAVLEITAVCGNCGLNRHHNQSIRTRDRSGFTYSNHNPMLRAPAGVSQTGVSVREALQHKYWKSFCANGGQFTQPQRTTAKKPARKTTSETKAA